MMAYAVLGRGMLSAQLGDIEGQNLTVERSIGRQFLYSIKKEGDSRIFQAQDRCFWPK